MTTLNIKSILQAGHPEIMPKLLQTTRVAKLRCSKQKFSIETEKRDSIPAELRYCRLRNNKIVKNEFNFPAKWPFYSIPKS